MAGLLDDSVQSMDVGMRGLADASQMNIKRDQANRAINAERIGDELHTAGQLIGTAVGSIWKMGGKGGQLGMREGDTYAQMFTGKRPSPAGNMSSGEGSVLGSLFQYLNDRNKPQVITNTPSQQPGPGVGVTSPPMISYDNDAALGDTNFG